MNLTVLVGDMKIGHYGDTLITHALGSCLGLMAFDPDVKVAGLLHAMLPLSNINPEKALVNPAMFVDTGVQAAAARWAGTRCLRSASATIPY
jgi:chemotaxis protein CheD